MDPARSARTRRATFWLLLVTAIWGASFLWTEIAMDAAAGALGPGAPAAPAAALFVAGRFGLAWVLMAAPTLWRRARAKRSADRAAPGSQSPGFQSPGFQSTGLTAASALYAAVLLAGFALQTVALGELDAAVSAFLTSIYVSLTALLTALLTRRRPAPATLVGVALATLGAGFIDGPPQVAFGPAAWLTLLSALIFAVGILLTDHLTRRHEPIALTRVSMGFAALGASLWAAALLGALDIATREALIGAALTPRFLLPMVLNGLLANVLALSLINLFQRELDPVRAAILYSLEPVWTAAFVVVFASASPSLWLWGGGAALLVGNLVAELAPRRGHSSSR
jgi:drug/metabolite transporter (DMT)-like permease